MSGKQPTTVTFDGLVSQAVRQYLRDLPDFRKRFEGRFVFEDDEIEFHVEMALDQLNALAPVSRWTRRNVPYRSWLVRATAISLCKSRFHQLEGEEVARQDPGGVTATFPEFQSLARRLDREWQGLAAEVIAGKHSVNLGNYLDNADGIPSVYSPREY